MYSFDPWKNGDFPYPTVGLREGNQFDTKKIF